MPPPRLFAAAPRTTYTAGLKPKSPPWQDGADGPFILSMCPSFHSYVLTIGCFLENGQFEVAQSFGTGQFDWDVASGTPMGRPLRFTSVHSIAFSSDGRHIVSGSTSGIVCVWTRRRTLCLQ